MKLAFSVQYFGAPFFGFQKQKQGRTVQEELEKAFSIVLRHPVRIFAAGRTDSGVHALAQVIHLSTNLKEPNLHKLIYGVNSLLPREISIIHGAVVSDTFHARFSCLSREYLYRIANTPYRLVYGSQYSHWIREKLDIALMQEAAQALLGEQDFASFTPLIYVKKGEKTLRRIDEIQIAKVGPYVLFYIAGSGFLHNMVRILTGTLVEIGLGKKKVGDIQKILLSRSRLSAGITLPAKGLCFLRASYEEYKTPTEIIPEYEILMKYLKKN